MELDKFLKNKVDMKKPIFLFIVTIAIAFASCDHERKTNMKTQHENFFDIAKMVSDFENYDCYECPNRDTVSYLADVDLLIEYCKKPDFKLVPNVERFLDSISEYTGIPVHMPDPPEDELGIVHRAVHELSKFQTGDRSYYPEKEVMEALDCMGFGLGDIWSHGGDIWYISMYYWYCFATQAALLSPKLDFVSHMHSPDNQIGLLSYHEWSPCPMMTFMVRQRDNYCTIQLVDEEVNLKKIFQIEDREGRKYYLLASGGDNIQFDSLCAYLYEKSHDSISFIAKGTLPYATIFACFYKDVIIETDEKGNILSTEVFSNFAITEAKKHKLNISSFIDSLQIIYNPKQYRWDLCIRNGGEYWHKIDSTKSLYLHLDEEKPYFEVH